MKTSLIFRYILFVTILLSFITVKGQFNDTIFYFQNQHNPELLGVKNAKGKIILPAEFRKYSHIEFDKPILDSYIEFRTREQYRTTDSTSPAIRAMEVFDRKGRFLYFAQFFDNGGDYYVEGLRRYVDPNHQKIGFVNRSGKICIKAKWDFASPFNYGYATVYTGGWKKKFIAGGEHWTVVPISKSSKCLVINKNGRVVQPIHQSGRSIYYSLKGKIYPYSFKYNNKEREMLHQINMNNQLKEITRMQYSKTQIGVRFEIVERPTRDFSYYILQAFENGQKIEDLTVYANQAGSVFYHCDYDNPPHGFKPLNEWISQIMNNHKE